MTNVTDFDPPSQDDVQFDLRGLFLGAIRASLEALLEEEIKRLVGGARWARMGRKDYRNGSYLRSLVTSMGHLEIDVPRSRKNGSAGAVLGRYQRRTDEVDEAIVASYVNGISTRKMGKVTEALMGQRVGRSTVSRVTKTLEERVEELRRAPITEEIPYLYLDATFLDARWARRVENVAALVAYGVGMDGRRRLLAVTIGAQESEASWADLLRKLTDRGLKGVKLVISDDHAGLKAAVRSHLPDARAQRCVVHLQRNALDKTPWRLRGRAGREIGQIFAAPSLNEAKKRLEAFKSGLGEQIPEAAACVEAGFSAATQFYVFPQAHWRRLRSTNGLERLHGEIKRRIRAVGAFPDRASALRLITAVALETTASWGQREYLNMKLLKAEEEKRQAKAA